MTNTENPNLKNPVGESDYIEGNKDAKITLVEYGDYECPHCQKADKIIKKIQAEMGDDLRFVFRNFPLEQSHPHALHAAESAEIAGAEGKFWEMHDKIFANQQNLADEDLAAYAEEIGLDKENFSEKLESGEFEEKVREDFENGVMSGVNGTPTFFINGSRFNGSYNYDDLLEAIRSAEA